MDKHDKSLTNMENESGANSNWGHSIMAFGTILYNHHRGEEEKISCFVFISSFSFQTYRQHYISIFKE